MSHTKAYIRAPALNVAGEQLKNALFATVARHLTDAAPAIRALAAACPPGQRPAVSLVVINNAAHATAVDFTKAAFPHHIVGEFADPPASLDAPVKLEPADILPAPIFVFVTLAVRRQAHTVVVRIAR